jgi:hypothetical protein
MKGLFAIAVLCAFAISARGYAQAPPKPVDPAVETAVMQVLKDFMDGFNRQDPSVYTRTYHFPHYRLASGRMTVLEGPEQALADLRSRLEADWDHSAWGRLRIIHSSPDKVHVDTLFTRYRKDGSVIGSFESIYVVTKEQGRWGVKLRSSMAP